MGRPERFLPDPGEIYLDHVGWYVPNLDKVGQVFAKLGFPLTPEALHVDREPETGEVIPQGSANRLAMLEEGYLEFLTDVADIDSLVARHMRERRALYVGVHLTAFSVADAKMEAARLAADGIPLQPTVNLRRTVEAADGSEAEAGFTVIRAAFDAFPEGRIQTLSHLTPEHVWQDRFIASENGITGLAEVVFSVPDPAASAERLAAFTGCCSRQTNDGMVILLDRGRLSFVKGDIMAITEIGLVSRNLDQTRDYFLGREISFGNEGSKRLIIEPGDALGAKLMITPAEA